MFALGDQWRVNAEDIFLYADQLGDFDAPLPTLHGLHQSQNAGLAAAMLRAQNKVPVHWGSIRQGIAEASWPSRMQSLSAGPLTALVADQAVTLDGGHNANAGLAIAGSIQGQLHLVLGMLANKDPRAIVEPLAGRIRSLTIVPVPRHDSHPAEAFGPGARAATDLEDALLNVPSDDYPILIAGSLYLAGEALRLNDEVPD